ncbi:MAG: ATP-binding cassette domain-containing protein [Methylococcales bacterium]|nr:ATP-binding cassette domain-containing protein [Methylococcales bacterium]
MTDIVIDIKHKTYQAKAKTSAYTAIKDLNLVLKSHEFVCLVGPSGCGKTTLLNTISGLDTDFEGEILIGESHQSPNIGYVFQNPRLLPWRTVRENIELVLTGEDHKAVIDRLLEIMQLKHLEHVYPEQLSLGMSRRIAIIRAFAINPDILLMDEPFVSLDAPSARQVRRLLMTLWQQRPHTILFVTHDLREAIILADKLVFLSVSPMKVVSEITVPIARDARDNELRVEEFRQKLINDHAEIRSLL